MDNDNKQLILEKIWSDPAPVLGGEWTQRRNAWESQRGKLRLWRNPSGSITLHFNHGSGRGGDKAEIFDHIQQENNLGGFWETLQYCARCYGVELQFTERERKKMRQGELIRAIVPSLVSSLSENPDGVAAAYINGRGFAIDKHFGELTPDSIQRVRDALNAQGVQFTDDDLKALGLTAERASQGYNVIIPYYRNGQAVGIKYRNVLDPLPDGVDKYKNNADMERGGYSDTLSSDKPAVIIEGELDAIALMQSGVKNVVAMSAPEINEQTAQMLSQRGIKTLVYVPDIEKSKDGTGKQRTDLIDRAVKRFQKYSPEDLDLFIATLPTDGADKMDVADYYRTHGAAELLKAIGENRNWWDYQLGLIEDELSEREQAGEKIQEWEILPRIRDVYDRCNPFDRQRIKDNIKNTDLYKHYGITPETLSDVDEAARQKDYTDRIKAAAEDLAAAVERGANPVKIAEIVQRLSDTQGSNTREQWREQLTATFEDELKEMQEQPKTLETKWQLGVIGLDKKTLIPNVLPWEKIEFYPADISVFCAPTSHGKTMILFQSAIDLVRDYPEKTFMYVSCEESKRQLLERAINVYLDIPTTEDGIEWADTQRGKKIAQNYCFIRGTRKRALKAYFRKDNAPLGYTPDHWERLSARIAEGVRRYGESVRPRLKLIHTDATAESIAANVNYYVEQYQEQNIEIGAVFVDYMQLLSSDNNNAPRNIELKDVCKALKECAARTELPIIIAAQTNRQSISEGVDSVTVANIGEGADIERIAHDIYFVWQVDKTKRDKYFTIPKSSDKDPNPDEKFNPLGDRSRRIFTKPDTATKQARLKKGYLYVEQMKARDGRSDGWGLFPFDGERGKIDDNDTNKMLE